MDFPLMSLFYKGRTLGSVPAHLMKVSSNEDSERVGSVLIINRKAWM